MLGALVLDVSSIFNYIPDAYSFSLTKWLLIK